MITERKLDQSAKLAAVQYGAARMLSVTPTLVGDHATATYRFDQPAVDQANEPWVLENGEWHNDQC